MAASVEEFVELLSSEQHVDIARLRHLARHGIHPAVRGEVWMYLLGVLSADKSQEMSSVRALYNAYDILLSSPGRSRHFPPEISEAIRSEAEEIWRNRIPSTNSFSEIHQRWPRARQGGAGLHQTANGASRQINRRLRAKPILPLNQVPSSSSKLNGCSNKAMFSSEKANLVAEDSTTSAPRQAGATTSDTAGEPKQRSAQTDRAVLEDKEPDELKQRFIDRLHNVVSSWITKKALAERESSLLRMKLAEAKAAEAQSASGSTFGSTSSPERPGDPDEEEQEKSRQSHPRPQELPDFCVNTGTDEDEPEEIFDPAMGMGVEDSDSDYTSDGQQRIAEDSVFASSSQGSRWSRVEQPRSPRLNEHQHGQAREYRTSGNITGLGLDSYQSTSPPMHSISSPRGYMTPSRSRTPASGRSSPRRFHPHRFDGLGSPSMTRSSTSSSEEEETEDDLLPDEELIKTQKSLWKPQIAQLASPFVLVSGQKRVEAGVFFAFEKLMSLIETHRSERPLSHLLASFHSLFRRTLPDLRAYFDDEGFDVTPFVKGWLESLFSGQMTLNNEGCLRLWDAYFSMSPSSLEFASSPLSLHLYVCIAVLLHCKDTLEELDRSECESFLRGLPTLEIAKILNEAANLRLSHRQAILTQSEGEGDVDVDGDEELARAVRVEAEAEEQETARGGLRGAGVGDGNDDDDGDEGEDDGDGGGEGEEGGEEGEEGDEEGILAAAGTEPVQADEDEYDDGD